MPQPEVDPTEGIAREMMGRDGVSFLYCEACACAFVAIMETATKRLAGVGCPECRYAWPLGDKPAA